MTDLRAIDEGKYYGVNLQVVKTVAYNWLIYELSMMATTMALTYRLPKHLPRTG